jgi:hypothetical protein
VRSRGFTSAGDFLGYAVTEQVDGGVADGRQILFLSGPVAFQPALILAAHLLQKEENATPLLALST